MLSISMVEQIYSKDGWDAEASVWIATSEDVPGLALEDGAFDALLEGVRYAAPEILELNGCEKNGGFDFLNVRAPRIGCVLMTEYESTGLKQ